MLSKEEKVEIILLCGENTPSRQVADIFNSRHPNRNVNHTTVTRLLNKFKETGSINNNFKKPHANAKVPTEIEEEVCLTVVENGKTSIKQLSTSLDVPCTTVQKILKKNNFKPFKPKFINTLMERDFIPRFEFSAWYQGEYEENSQFPLNILWTDEATFSSNGTVNSQNCRWWATENPNFTIECRNQYSFKVNVLCGLLNNTMIGPFFFDENLTGNRYLQFLQQNLLPIINQMPHRRRQEIWYQLDGATVHCSVAIRQFLNETFNGRWIGRYSEYPMPARSPDLTPMDFFCWGLLKNEVYKHRPFRDREHLRTVITNCVRAIKPEHITNAVNDVVRRTELCMLRDGHHTEM